MAKVRPVAGIQLSGAIGGVVFCQRGGRTYARTHSVPRDPKTPAQRGRRRLFRDAVKAWRVLSEPDKASWRRRAARIERNGYHLFLAEFIAGRALVSSKATKR